MCIKVTWTLITITLQPLHSCIVELLPGEAYPTCSMAKSADERQNLTALLFFLLFSYPPYCSLPLRQPRNDTLPCCRTEPLLLVMQDRKEDTKVLKLVFKGSSHHVRSKRVELRQLFKQKAMNVDTAPSSGRVENEYITISYIEYTLSALRICVSFSRTRLNILVGNKGREKKGISIGFLYFGQRNNQRRIILATFSCQENEQPALLSLRYKFYCCTARITPC